MLDIRDPKIYCENLLKIQDKQKKIVPLKFNPPQEKLYNIIQEEKAKGQGVRLVVLKARQEGVSTMTEGVFFAVTATQKNTMTLIMAHVDDSTRHLFGMNKLFYDELPPQMKPMMKASNAQELVFENPTRDPTEKLARPGLRSRIRCTTAGGKGGGRSFTYQNVHGSEVAFWPSFNDTLLAVMQTVPDGPESMVVLETTANGYNAFKDFWDDAVAGRNGFRPVFLAWYEMPEYVRPVEPGTEWDDEERELMDTLGLTPEQMAWRRYTIKTKCAGSVDQFRQEYPTVAEEAFLATGRPFFDMKKLYLMLAAVPEPEHVGFFVIDEEAENGKPLKFHWEDHEKGGYIKRWNNPIEGTPYVIGGDTAGTGGDFFAGFGVNNVTGIQVCAYHREQGEKLFTQQMWCLGEFYNWALLAVEVNYGSYCQLMLEEWGYPNLYQRVQYDKIRKEYLEYYGYRTDSRTRPLMLSNLHTVMDEHGDSVRDRAMLEEALHFQYNDDGRPEAAVGYHDDLVMAAAICHMARDQQRSSYAEPKTEARKKLPEQLKVKGKKTGRKSV